MATVRWPDVAGCCMYSIPAVYESSPTPTAYKRHERCSSEIDTPVRLNAHHKHTKLELETFSTIPLSETSLSVCIISL